MLLIAHADGYTSVYAHNRSLLVGVGRQRPARPADRHRRPLRRRGRGTAALPASRRRPPGRSRALSWSRRSPSLASLAPALAAHRRAVSGHVARACCHSGDAQASRTASRFRSAASGPTTMLSRRPLLIGCLIGRRAVAWQVDPERGCPRADARARWPASLPRSYAVEASEPRPAVLRVATGAEGMLEPAQPSATVCACHVAGIPAQLGGKPGGRGAASPPSRDRPLPERLVLAEERPGRAAPAGGDGGVRGGDWRSCSTSTAASWRRRRSRRCAARGSELPGGRPVPAGAAGGRQRRRGQGCRRARRRSATIAGSPSVASDRVADWLREHCRARARDRARVPGARIRRGG